MAKTLEQILGFTAMTGVINSPAGGVASDILDPAWLTLTEPVEGQVAQWTNVAGQQQAASAVNFGSPSRKAKYTSVGTSTAKMIHAFEHMTHPLTLLSQLQQFDSPAIQARGEQIIDAQLMEFRRRFMNLRVGSIFSTLRFGKIYFDGNGGLLGPEGGAAPTTGLVQTASLQIPTAQLNIASSASWATASTNILDDIETKVLIPARKLGVKLTRAYYGTAVRNYLLSNTGVGKALENDTQELGRIRNRERFRLMGLDWTPLSDAWVNVDGTITDWFPSDYVVFTAEPDRSWYAMQEGTYLQPVGPEIIGAASAAELAAGFLPVTGMGSYAAKTIDPPGVQHYMFDSYFPAIKHTGYVWSINTVA